MRRRFQNLMNMETSLSPEDRKKSQFQLLCTVGKQVYIVSKGGANTIVWKVNDGEPTYCTPLEMLDQFDKWLSQKHIGFILTSGAKVKKSRDIGTLLSMKPTHTATIVGVTPEHKKELLYRWRVGLNKSGWEKAKGK